MKMLNRYFDKVEQFLPSKTFVRTKVDFTLLFLDC